MALHDVIAKQFEHPRGMPGRVVAWIMAHRSSNRDRNRWTVDLLKIQPQDHVLEIGCGPGLALEGCLARATTGMVVGLDHSQTMLDQACSRNRQAVQDGRLQLRLGSLEELCGSADSYDKIFSVNVVQFLDELSAAYTVFYNHLKPGGTVATTYMPRGQSPDRAQAWKMPEDVTYQMEQTGFVQIRVEELPPNPVPAICVIGSRPSAS
ncbi:MAG: methyltransferase domain-containing protein [Nitrospiraceae bacterium]